MRYVALALALVAAARVAEAHNNCKEVSLVVGYHRCHRFAGWAERHSMAIELGAAALRLDPDRIDGVADVARNGGMMLYHVTAAPGDRRSIAARGLAARTVLTWGAWYLAVQADVASITDAPQLVVEGVVGGAGTTTSAETHGLAVEATAAIGRRVRFGAWTFAGELAPGLQVASYTSAVVPKGSIADPVQWWPVLDARVKADLWIAPNFTLGVMPSADLLHPGDVSVAITLGAHLYPYDRMR